LGTWESKGADLAGLGEVSGIELIPRAPWTGDQPSKILLLLPRIDLGAGKRKV
jgi:hypothetical protein